MGAVSIAAVFAVIWWIVFFLVLPFGIKTREKPETPGEVPSAPLKPRLWLKTGVTTGIAIVLTVIVILLVRAGVFSWEGVLGSQSP